ncbi:MAG: hypothetical protein JO168_12660 [Solirubrobacterales bacterium]|nr:hypothetical protein [Solirubrobacterales bacterium]
MTDCSVVGTGVSSQFPGASRSRGALRASSASGTSEQNVDGEAIAITVFSAMRRWGLLELPIFFLFVRRGRDSLRILKELSFIHAARWSVIRRLPANGDYPERRLRFPRLYFESNFNGGWEEYIDAFSYTLTLGMWAFWGSSYGFPSALPPSPFKAYIRRNEYEAGHYYSAYPDATATTVLAALRVSPKVAALRAAANAMSPEQFAQAWSDFLRDEQRSL